MRWTIPAVAVIGVTALICCSGKSKPEAQAPPQQIVDSLKSVLDRPSEHVGKPVVVCTDRVHSASLVKGHWQIAAESEEVRCIITFVDEDAPEAFESLTREQIESILGLCVHGIIESVDEDDGGIVVRINDARFVRMH